MAKKWNLIVDVERCDNCRGCYIAVKDEHAGNEFPGYAAAQPRRVITGSISVAKSAAATPSSRRATHPSCATTVTMHRA